jgi:putative hydrolase of the HAD superfamily
LIEAVLFDLDNTLLDRDAGFRRFCRDLYRNRAIIRRTHTEEEAVALMVSIDADSRPRADMIGDMIRLWPGVFDDLEHGMRVYSTEYPRALHLEPSTRKLLEDLRDRGIPTAIVTNGPNNIQRAKARESGLEGLVRAVVISEELGVEKPDQGIFLRALELTGSGASTTLFVGDNPEADILGAQELGMLTAWVHRGREWPYASHRPDYLVGHVSEVGELVG